VLVVPPDDVVPPVLVVPPDDVVPPVAPVWPPDPGAPPLPPPLTWFPEHANSGAASRARIVARTLGR
jgi:hypothetical protein